MTNLMLRFVIFLLIVTSLGFAEQRRKVIIDQDCSGPGGGNMQTLLTLIQSPQVEVLGITVVSGNQWRDEEVARTLRLLELIGRTDTGRARSRVSTGWYIAVSKLSCGRQCMGKLPSQERGTIAGRMNMM